MKSCSLARLAPLLSVIFFAACEGNVVQPELSPSEPREMNIPNPPVIVLDGVTVEVAQSASSGWMACNTTPQGCTAPSYTTNYGWASHDGVSSVDYSLSAGYWWLCVAGLAAMGVNEWGDWNDNSTDMNDIANIRFQMDSAIREQQRPNTSQAHKDFWENEIDDLRSQELIKGNNIANRNGSTVSQVLQFVTACAPALKSIKWASWPPFV